MGLDEILGRDSKPDADAALGKRRGMRSLMKANDPIVLDFLEAIGVDAGLNRGVTIEIEVGELLHVTERRLVRKEVEK